MKTGKELKTDNFKNYNVIYGSVNNKHPKAVYVNLSAWAEPQSDEPLNYSRVIKDINKKVKQELYNYFSNDSETEFIKDRTIVDLDIRESGIRYGKRSFMNCEITLFLTTEIPITSDKMKYMLDNVSDLLVNSVFNDNKTFKFYKRKK